MKIHEKPLLLRIVFEAEMIIRFVLNIIFESYAFKYTFDNFYIPGISKNRSKQFKKMFVTVPIRNDQDRL